ncbi:MAG: hypothetical protein C4292_01520 [Nitrososphaera sp.]
MTAASPGDELESLRAQIRSVTAEIMRQAQARMALAAQVGEVKSRLGIDVKDEKVEQEVRAMVLRQARETGMSGQFALRLLNMLLSESEAIQLERQQAHAQNQKQQQQQQKVASLRGTSKANEWGNQDRSYVLHPYTLVKDPAAPPRGRRAGLPTSAERRRGPCRSVPAKEIPLYRHLGHPRPPRRNSKEERGCRRAAGDGDARGAFRGLCGHHVAPEARRGADKHRAGVAGVQRVCRFCWCAHQGAPHHP